MTLDSETNRPQTKEERILLLKQVMLERFGEWETRKDIPIQDNHEASR